MQPLELAAEDRQIMGKRVKRLRREGVIPANIFGHGDSRAIQIQRKALEGLLTRGGRSGLVALTLGGGKSTTTLLKRYTRDPRSGLLTHADFQAVSLTETVHATVPLRFIGEPPAVKRGGILLHPLSEVQVEAQARNIPDAIEVDLSGLEEMDSAIHVSQVRAPEGVTLLDPAESVVARVQAPRTEKEEAAEAGVEPEAAAAEAEAAKPESGTGSGSAEGSAG